MWRLMGMGGESGRARPVVLVGLFVAIVWLGVMWETRVHVTVDVDIEVRGRVEDELSGAPLRGAAVLICRYPDEFCSVDRRTAEFARHDADSALWVLGISAASVSDGDGLVVARLRVEGSYEARLLAMRLGLAERQPVLGALHGFAVRHNDYSELLVQFDSGELVPRRSSGAGAPYVARINLGRVLMKPK